MSNLTLNTKIPVSDTLLRFFNTPEELLHTADAFSGTMNFLLTHTSASIDQEAADHMARLTSIQAAMFEMLLEAMPSKVKA